MLLYESALPLVIMIGFWLMQWLVNVIANQLTDGKLKFTQSPDNRITIALR